MVSSLSFRRVVNVVQFLLGNSPAGNYPKETVLQGVRGLQGNLCGLCGGYGVYDIGTYMYTES
jgi:hypothetical protein